MSQISPDQIDQYVTDALQEWGSEVLTVLTAKIKQRKLVLTGELLQSLQYEVLKGTATRGAKLLLAFEQSGRIKDMRNVRHKKMPPVDVIEDYVRKVGLHKFKYVPGYSGGKFPTETQAIRRIAWGIARAKQRRNRQKPKKWFAKPFYSQINSLIDSLLNGYTEASSGAITQNIK